jgi:hypothetical protein
MIFLSNYFFNYIKKIVNKKYEVELKKKNHSTKSIKWATCMYPILMGNHCVLLWISFPALSSQRARDMEVEHFSLPDHPLILINQALEYSCELVICSGCEGQIWGPCYSCTSCYFFLHKKCAELPREIKRRIHRTIPLHLLARPPSHYKQCACDRCAKPCNSFVYHCSSCEFDLDIKCAFQPGFFLV